MKTAEELNALKAEFEALKAKLDNLSEDELAEIAGAPKKIKYGKKNLDQVTGGQSDTWGGYFRCSNPDCPARSRHYDVADEFCNVCWWPMEWVKG